MSGYLFKCKCACHQTVTVTKVAPTSIVGCMVYQIDDHPAAFPSNSPLCLGAGAMVDLHPRSITAFRDILASLGFSDRDILTPLHGRDPVLA